MGGQQLINSLRRTKQMLPSTMEVSYWKQRLPSRQACSLMSKMKSLHPHCQVNVRVECENPRALSSKLLDVVEPKEPLLEI